MGQKATGYDLGQNITSGAEVPDTFEFVSNLRVLYDARQGYSYFHASHTGHAVTTTVQYGEVTSWPRIAPFKEGWIALLSIDTIGPDTITAADYGSTPDTTGVQSTKFRFIRFNDFGNVLWQSPLIDAVDEPIWAGDPSMSSAYQLAAGNDTHVLFFMSDGSNYDVRKIDFSADDGTYSFGSVIASIPSSGAFDGNSNAQPRLHKIATGGWLIWAHSTGSPNRDLTAWGFDDDLDYLGTNTLSAAFLSTEQLPRFTSMWQGAGPAIVQITDRSDYNPVRHWPITFDGASAPTIGAVVNQTLDKNIVGNGYQLPAGDGYYENAFNNTGNPTYFLPSDGSNADAGVDAPYYWVFNDVESLANTPDGTVAMSIATVSDFDNTVAPSSPYYGDAYGQVSEVCRHYFKNWVTGDQGYVDLVITMPEPYSSGYLRPWGEMAFHDVDLDESGWSVENPTTNKVFCWMYNYWTMQPPTDGIGYPGGENRLSTYWIVQLGEPVTPTPTPETPGWVNFFNTGGVPDPDCPMLGNGSHKVFLYDRGGARMLAQITDTSLVRWNRKRDDISSATIRVNEIRPECADVLRSIATGRHEIVIFRNGERVWEGPITLTTYTSDGVEITAEDIGFYLSRTIMHAAYDNRYSAKKSKVAPVTRRMQVILANEMRRKEALGYNILRFLDIRTHPQTTRTSRLTYAYQSSVWEELDYMAAKLSLDYTTVGRRLLINDVHDVIGRTQMLTDKDFLNPLVITSYGKELATRSAVTDGEGHWAAVGGIDPFYGEVELLNTTYGEEVQAGTPGKPTAAELKAMMSEFASQAQRNIAGRYPIPTVVRVPDNTQLDPSAPVTIDQLVPGIRVPIRATRTIITLEQEQKLDSVSVEETSRGERVSVTLSPAPGTTPWDDSSELPTDDEEAD